MLSQLQDQEPGLAAKPRKSNLEWLSVSTSVMWLHGSGMVKPEPTKIEAVQPLPQVKKYLVNQGIPQGIIDVSLLGAVLSQYDDSGLDHSVAYYSNHLVIRLGVHVFDLHLLGLFTIQTDHQSLEWLDCLKKNYARLTH